MFFIQRLKRLKKKKVTLKITDTNEIPKSGIFNVEDYLKTVNEIIAQAYDI